MTQTNGGQLASVTMRVCRKASTATMADATPPIANQLPGTLIFS
jgi:hypothetical protein